MEENNQTNSPAAQAEKAQQPVTNQANQTPKKSGSCGKIVAWGIIIIVIFVVLAYVLMFLQSLGYRPLGIPEINKSNNSNQSVAIVDRNSNSNTSTTTATYGGKWNLQVLSNSTTTGVGPTSITTSGTASVDFDMPSAEGGKFTASAPWTSDGSGTVGPSTETVHVTGKINLSGEIKSGQLHFTISYTEEDCPVTITTPLGSSTINTCNGDNVPDIHTIDIEIKNGAAKSSTIMKGSMAAGYNFTGTENWTLTKK